MHTRIKGPRLGLHTVITIRASLLILLIMCRREYSRFSPSVPYGMICNSSLRRRSFRALISVLGRAPVDTNGTGVLLILFLVLVLKVESAENCEFFASALSDIINAEQCAHLGFLGYSAAASPCMEGWATK